MAYCLPSSLHILCSNSFSHTEQQQTHFHLIYGWWMGMYTVVNTLKKLKFDTSFIEKRLNGQKKHHDGKNLKINKIIKLLLLWGDQINRSQNKNITMTRLKTNLISDLSKLQKSWWQYWFKGCGLKTTHDHKFYFQWHHCFSYISPVCNVKCQFYKV